jgi:hypothetical protein
MNEEFESELYETAWTFCKGCGGPCRKGEDYCALPCAATFVDACNDTGFQSRPIDGSARITSRALTLNEMAQMMRVRSLRNQRIKSRSHSANIPPIQTLNKMI